MKRKMDFFDPALGRFEDPGPGEYIIRDNPPVPFEPQESMSVEVTSDWPKATSATINFPNGETLHLSIKEGAPEDAIDFLSVLIPQLVKYKLRAFVKLDSKQELCSVVTSHTIDLERPLWFAIGCEYGQYIAHGKDENVDYYVQVKPDLEHLEKPVWLLNMDVADDEKDYFMIPLPDEPADIASMLYLIAGRRMEVYGSEFADLVKYLKGIDGTVGVDEIFFRNYGEPGYHGEMFIINPIKTFGELKISTISNEEVKGILPETREFLYNVRPNEVENRISTRTWNNERQNFV